MKNYRTVGFVLILMAGAVCVQAQTPTIRNERTGSVIKLRAVPKTPTNVASTGAGVAPVATAKVNVPNGTRTVSLIKSPVNKDFESRRGASSSELAKDVVCTTTQVNAESGNFEVANFSPNTEIVYPGSIIDGMTIPSGEYRQIPAKRNPIVIAISTINGGSAPVSTAVEQPNLGSVREAINKLTAGLSFASGVEVGETKIETVYTSEEASMALDIHARNLIGSLSSAVKTNTEANKITIIKIVKQRYYSVDVVPPFSDRDFFEDTTTAILPAWTYIASVKYGRIGIMVMTFESKQSKIDASLDAKARGFMGSISGSIDVEILSSFKGCQIRAFQVGGEPININGTAATPEEARNLFRQFDSWTKKKVANPQPIAYTLRFARYENGGPAIASLQSTLTYNLRRCETRKQRIEATLQTIECVRSDDNGDNRPGEDLIGKLETTVKRGNGAVVPALYQKQSIVWQRGGCGISLKTGAKHIVSDGTRVFDDPLDPDARLVFGGDINDDDDCGTFNTGHDDDIGDEKGKKTTLERLLSNISATPVYITIDHKSGGVHVRQNWMLRRIYQ